MIRDFSNRKLVMITIPALAPANADHHDWRVAFSFGEPGFVSLSGYGGEWRNLLVNHEELGIELHPEATVVFFNQADPEWGHSIWQSTHFDVEEIVGPPHPWSMVQTVPMSEYRRILTRLHIPWMSAEAWLQDVEEHDLYPATPFLPEPSHV